MEVSKYSFIIDKERNIVEEIIVGEWTKLDAYRYCIDFAQDVVPKFLHKPWAKRVDLNMWIPTTDIVEIIGNHLRWATKHEGMLYSANICLSDKQREVLSSMFHLGENEEYSKIFRCVEEADEWLKRRGF